MNNHEESFAVFNKLVGVWTLISRIVEVKDARRMQVVGQSNFYTIENSMINDYISGLDDESKQYVMAKFDDFKWWMRDMYDEVPSKVGNGPINNPAVVRNTRGLESVEVVTNTMNSPITSIQFRQAGISKFQDRAIAECEDKRGLESVAALTETMKPPITSIQFPQAGISKFQDRAIAECDDEASMLTKKSMRTVGTKGTTKSNASTRLHFKEEIRDFEVNVKHEENKNVMTCALKMFNNLFECINGKGGLQKNGRSRSVDVKNEVTQVFRCSCNEDIQFKYICKFGTDGSADAEEKKWFVCKAYSLKGESCVVREHFTLKIGKGGIDSAIETVTDGGFGTGRGASFMAVSAIPESQVVDDVEVEESKTFVRKRKMASDTEIHSEIQHSLQKQKVKKAKVMKEATSLLPTSLEKGNKPACRRKKTIRPLGSRKVASRIELEKGRSNAAWNGGRRHDTDTSDSSVYETAMVSKTYASNKVSKVVNVNLEIPGIQVANEVSPQIVVNDSNITTGRTEEKLDFSRESGTTGVQEVHDEEESIERKKNVTSVNSQGRYVDNEERERVEDNVQISTICHSTKTTSKSFPESDALSRSSTAQKEGTEKSTRTFKDVVYEQRSGRKFPSETKVTSGTLAVNALTIHCTPPLLHLKKNKNIFYNVGCVCTINIDSNTSAEFLGIGRMGSSSEKIECIESYILKQLLNNEDQNEMLVDLFSDNFASADEDLWKLSEGYNPMDWSSYTGDSNDNIVKHTFLIKELMSSDPNIPDHMDWLTFTDLIRYPLKKKQQQKKKEEISSEEESLPFENEYNKLLKEHEKKVLSKVPSPKQLAKLYRMLLPLHAQIIAVEDGNSCDTNCSVVKEYGLKISLFDLWLLCKSTQQKAIQVLLRVAVDIPNYYDPQRYVTGPTLAHHQTYFDTLTRYRYQHIQNAILKTLQRSTVLFDVNGVKIQLHQHLEFKDIMIYDRFSVLLKTTNMDGYTQSIYDVRKVDVGNYLEQKVLEHDCLDGFIVKTPATGTSIEQFTILRQKYKCVNLTFPRFFIPTISRPRFARINEFDSKPAALRALHDTLFTEEGYLVAGLNNDIKWVHKHGYINFTKSDKRWQIPISENNSVWERIKTILEEYGLVESDHEVIDEITLLIAGTVFQTIHTDIGRQQTVWLKDRSPESEVNYKSTVGWEANRLCYNAEVASKYGHSTLLIGMGLENPKIKLGIQNNQVQWLSPCKTKCRVLNGKDNELIDVDRTSTYCVVVECKVGCRFSGDLQHCGVSNVVRDTEDYENRKILIKSIDKYKEGFEKKKHEDLLHVIIPFFQQFQRLDNLSRLFVSTKKVNSKITIPINSVSYDECIDPKIQK
jgi:hypothetical protein